MFYTKNQRLAEKIIDFLAYHPKSNSVDMKNSIKIMYGDVSKQALHKSLKRLMGDGVVVKTGRTYSLNMAWASKMSHLNFFIESNYLNPRSSHSINLPKRDKQKITYTFQDLISLDLFWGHLAITLILRNLGESFYFYNPHEWFFLAHEYESKTYFESIESYGVEHYTVVGSRTNLDLWAEKQHPEKNLHYYCSPKQLFNHRLYLTAIGEYYVQVKISEEMARRIDLLFRNTNIDIDSSSQPEGMYNFFKQKSVCTMVIEKNKEKATRFRRKIGRFF